MQQDKQTNELPTCNIDTDYLDSRSRRRAGNRLQVVRRWCLHRCREQNHGAKRHRPRSTAYHHRQILQHIWRQPAVCPGASGFSTSPSVSVCDVGAERIVELEGEVKDLTALAYHPNGQLWRDHWCAAREGVCQLYDRFLQAAVCPFPFIEACRSFVPNPHK